MRPKVKGLEPFLPWSRKREMETALKNAHFLYHGVSDIFMSYLSRQGKITEPFREILV
jgi:hypothetical protein